MNENEKKTEDSETSKNPEENEAKKEDTVFCVPSIPPLKPPSIQSEQSLDYVQPQWSAIPPQPDDLNEESKLDQEGFCDHYFLEVIKGGTVVDKIKLVKEYTTFGRLASCDVLCEHPSLSRFHAVLQYSDGSDEKYPKGLYLFDLGSTHGTFINKTRLEALKFTRVEVESVIKFGMSTRLYILHGPKPVKIGDGDLKINLTHEQMKKIKERYDKIALKLRIRKELDEEEAHGEWQRNDKGIDWGMLESGETATTTMTEADDDEESTTAAAAAATGIASDLIDLNHVDESYYADDPRKALKAYFDRENDELEYDMEELGPSRFKCRIRLPILNDFGEYMYAECEHTGKKKECQAQCALEACRILNAQGVLKPHAGESGSSKRRKQQHRDWQSQDYYDSDEDTYLDRTGDIEKKRQKRMDAVSAAAAATATSSNAASKNKVHTFDSIKDDMKRLFNEKAEIDAKLNKCKDVFRAVSNDDIDDYINSLKACEIDTITRAKLKRRLAEIENELIKYEKLLVVAKPSDFDVEKWKSNLMKPFKSSVDATSVSSLSKSQQIKVEEVVKPTEGDKKQIDNSASKKQPTPTSTPTPVVIENKKTPSHKLDTSEKEITKLKVEKKKSENLAELEMLEKPYEDNKDYAVWMPPENQTGDGKTKLNEKYGY